LRFLLVRNDHAETTPSEKACPALPGAMDGFTLAAFDTKRIVPVVHAIHFITQRRQLLGIATRAEMRVVGDES
jgi:hypothetical protein